VCLSSVSLLLLLFSIEFGEFHQLRQTVFIVLFCGLFRLITRRLWFQAMLYIGIVWCGLWILTWDLEFYTGSRVNLRSDWRSYRLYFTSMDPSILNSRRCKSIPHIESVIVQSVRACPYSALFHFLKILNDLASRKSRTFRGNLTPSRISMLLGASIWSVIYVSRWEDTVSYYGVCFETWI
jgi:hypothetical protein